MGVAPLTPGAVAKLDVPLDVLVVNAGSTSLKLSRCSGEDLVASYSSLDEALAAGPPDAVAHRVVHGGDRTGPAVVDDAVLEELRALVELAPLHQPPALDAIERTRSALPGVPQVACFDTAFHATIPPAALPEVTRARVELGFSANIDLGDGLRRDVEAFRADAAGAAVGINFGPQLAAE